MKKLISRFGPLVTVSALVLLLWAVPAFASGSYTVQKGDSLYLIGKKYGVSVAELKSANGLSGDFIYPGQTLAIPGGTSSGGTSSGSRYTVVRGDTLYLISQRYGVSVDSIKSANNLTSNVIYPGQVLTIGAAARTTTETVSRSYSRNEMDLLARAVYAEAGAEVYTGQVAVAAVILNRVASASFPNTVSGVIYQPYAFECVDNGQINLPATQTAVKAVQDALAGWDPSNGALFFFNPAKTTNKFLWSRTITAKIGNHYFAK